MDWGWFLPEPVSTFGERIDGLYYLILWITGVIFVLTEGLLVWFIVKYRHKEGRRAEYSHGSQRLEIVWTVVPFVLVLLIAWVSADVWLDAKVIDRTPPGEGDVVVRVMAKQFEWNVTYAGADGRLDTDDDFVKRNQLHVPVGRNVRIELMAEDVIHSFFLPELRVKQDAVPGMMIPVWFAATRAGEYPIACAELCGLGHTTMDGRLIVHEADAYDAWLATETGTAAAPSAAPAPADTADVEIEGVDEPTETEAEESA